MKQRKTKFKIKPGVIDEVVKGESAENAEDLTRHEFFGAGNEGPSLNSSDADENANEGVGDGTIGRTVRNQED